ncbi:hypothetical protein N665_1141s0006 [Sinapis alba]|nr:hypothetical protein N665_1141s0006 [Sinapis alba]
MDRFVIKRKTPPPTISTNDLPCDPAKRKRIQDYDHNQRDSVEQEKAFCLFCYLFRVQAGKQGGSDTFVSTGFSNWNRADSFSKHVGDHSSFHYDAKNKCEDLMRQESTNKNNCLELLKYTTKQNETVKKVVMNNAPKNNQMTSPPIQKDIAHCFAEEVTKSIIHEIDNDVFGLLVDESDDVSDKEQMAVVFLRGQGYDGASNMKREFNGLRSLILKESISAYYVHCFAHQLQIFDMVHVLLNAVGASCKRNVILTESNRKRMEEGFSNGIIKTGTRLNQDLSLKKPGNTRWGSHYKTLLRLDKMFPCIIEVLEHIQIEGLDGSKRQHAFGLLKYLHTFDLVFFISTIQKRDQEILNAISLVGSTKRQLQKLMDEGWEVFVAKEEFVDSRRPKKKKTGITNLHHYKMDCFYTVLDMQLQEFNDRFDEVNSQLLVCMTSLSLIDSVCQFDKSLLMKLAEFYQDDFSSMERRSLEQQLDIDLDNVQRDERFTNLESLGDLARVLVDTRKHLSHSLVYRLLKLCLILPVAIESVERCFSAMKIVKTTSRNSIGDEFLSNCLVCFIEKQVLETVTNETMIKRFQDMSERRIHF